MKQKYIMMALLFATFPLAAFPDGTPGKVGRCASIISEPAELEGAIPDSLLLKGFSTRIAERARLTPTQTDRLQKATTAGQTLAAVQLMQNHYLIGKDLQRTLTSRSVNPEEQISIAMIAPLRKSGSFISFRSEIQVATGVTSKFFDIVDTPDLPLRRHYRGLGTYIPAVEFRVSGSVQDIRRFLNSKRQRNYAKVMWVGTSLDQIGSSQTFPDLAAYLNEWSRPGYADSLAKFTDFWDFVDLPVSWILTNKGYYPDGRTPLERPRTRTYHSADFYDTYVID